METWKDYKIPTVLDLFWMIPQEEELPEEVRVRKENKTVVIGVCPLKVAPSQDPTIVEQSAQHSTMESSQRVSERAWVLLVRASAIL